MAPEVTAAGRTTVTFDYQQGSIGANHDMDGGYQQAAAALDDLEDPAVQAYRDSADAFFADPSGQTTLQTRAFEIDRIP